MILQRAAYESFQIQVRRIHENREVVGTDEAFFEDEKEKKVLHDLFTQKAGILDGDADSEVDLASYA